jgi:DNA-binding GntR family transcriptional regulator
MRQRQGRSLTEDVYESLRADILHGRRGPGDRLHIRDTAATLGVSLGVVREAATRLATERLLDANPQSGFRVRALSPGHLADLTWMRCHVESLAVRESVRHGDANWEAALVAAHHLLIITAPMLDGEINEAWMTAHRRFHAALTAGCANQTLLEVRQRLFDEAELYRHWSARTKGAERDLPGEHTRLMDAVLARQEDLAADLLVEHLRYTAATVAEPARTS